MEDPRFLRRSQTIKWVVTAYLGLSLLGFLVAGLISVQRYDLDHNLTTEYYLGNEAKMAYPKLYSQLITTAHVHSFMMPVVFLLLWIGFLGVPIRGFWKGLFILGGTLSILIYNAAPFLVRYHSPQWVPLFSVGGVGLFFFYFLPAFLILYEAWIGFRET